MRIGELKDDLRYGESMDNKQIRAEFEAWAVKEQIAYRDEKHGLCFYNGQRHSYWIGYLAGRAALQESLDKSQDREDADQWFEQLRILITEFGMACADSGAVEMHMMPKIFDHARRIEGEGK